MHQMRISVGNPKEKNSENCIRAEKNNNKYCARKLSQICRRIELCMREIFLRFEMTDAALSAINQLQVLDELDEEPT
jgi:hypothetical protein